MQGSTCDRSRRKGAPFSSVSARHPSRRPSIVSTTSISASNSARATSARGCSSASTSARRPRNGVGNSVTDTALPAPQSQSNAMKVYIRVRPFSEREISQKTGTHSTVRIDAQNPTQVTILDPSRGFRPLTTHPFARCFWSVFAKDEKVLLDKVDAYLTGGMNSARRSRAQSLLTGQTLSSSLRRGTRAVTNGEAAQASSTAYDGAGSAPVMVDANVSHPPYAGQEQVYTHVGRPIVSNTLDGYNGCVFAYGQTGSGKTFTMLGYAPSRSDIQARREACASATNLDGSTPLNGSEELFESDDGDDVVDKRGLDPNELQGIIPRACADLFDGLRAKRAKDSDFTYRVELSYYEIYNEKVFDLIRPQRNTDLRIRNSPNAGPFIEGLTWKMVSKEEDVASVIRKGMQERHTAATKFNDRSSRSHAILTFNIVQLSMDDSDNAFQMRSKLNLVDLAGSERTGAAGAEGDEFHDGVKINQSLTVLGRVIDRLADLSQSKGGGGLNVPYRDSNLTWVLSDSIGGNSQTSMIATISPHSLNYEEMRQTIMYACRAQQVLNNARRNVDPMVLQLRELRAKIADLQLRLKEAGGSNYTNEYVHGLEKRVKELEWQNGDQARCISQLRAELESAGIADPTLAGKSSMRDDAGNADTGDVAASAKDGRGSISGLTYRRTNEQLQSELTSANREVVRLQSLMLETQKAMTRGKIAIDAEKTIETLQAECSMYRSVLRDWEGHLNQYNLYYWRWTTDNIFGTFEDKMNVLLRQCQGVMMDKDAYVMDALSHGESEQLRETAKLQRQHHAEVSALTAQHRESMEKLQREYAAKEAERAKRQKEVSSSSESRMQALQESFMQEKRRWTQVSDSMKLVYEEKIAAMRTEYQSNLKQLRESLTAAPADRQRQGFSLQELQEVHEADMKGIERDRERERQRREAELEMVKKQMYTELSRKEEQVAARDAQVRRAEEEASKLRHDNLKLQSDLRTKERQLATKIKDLLLKQESMIAVVNSVVDDYEKNPTNLEKDIEILRTFVSDTDYAAFRAKAKEMAFHESASRRASALIRNPTSVDEQRSREVEDIRSTIEMMRKTRSTQQANLQQVQQDVYEQLSRSRGFEVGAGVEDGSG
ncbi:hypothetical protein JKF63_05787 [Porcisia hertigi]|uniref:Kinesin motor domain-containing protein n=1 Tax=Porcisia hertigi TaxID=2761500 RepID=A0A836IUU9_9TRYP|nr:hypothetical protein JKF63_05787 [Porcisia hertigi]